MSIRDFSSQRLFVEAGLSAGDVVPLDGDQANYLLNVLRLRAGHSVLVFNGRDGEWRAVLRAEGRRALALDIGAQVRPQGGGPDIDYLFAPLKRARLDYMVQKAVEMGVGRLFPVLTRHTVADRVNVERMRANAIEAAEQCGILRLPEIRAPEKLMRVIETWDAGRALVFCDEGAGIADPVAALRDGLKCSVESGGAAAAAPPLAVLIGPEGGFSDDERGALLELPSVIRLSLGPRILRADTAAVAALAIVNAVAGDWRAWSR